mgnify:FL=1
MIRYISASIVVPVSGPFLRNGVVAVDEVGTITGVYEQGSHALNNTDIEFYEGVLIPGFVNAHCHIELSHMLNQTKKGLGLPKFLMEVMTQRDIDKDLILAKIEEQDKMMFSNGIQAVGDHVNTEYSASVKENSKIIYHTFVEIMGVNKDDAQKRIDRGRDVEYYFQPENTSITLHAPYSCSKSLFKAFKKVVSETNTLSIHNQESDEENKLFRYKQGGFLDFYKHMGMDFADFKAQARNSLQSYLPYLPVNNKLILVHNTFTSLKDLDFVDRMGREVYFCICPKANLYIENQLPKILNFIPDQNKMLVGTDSLASNDKLDILDELKVISKACPQLDFLQLLKWATINGAEALGLDSKIGTLEVDKRPGLILLKNMDSLRLTDEVTLERIV